MILNEERIRDAVLNSNYSDVFSERVKYDLFISHSFTDKKLILGLYHLFDIAGYNVWMDDTDDPDVIRDRMKSCKGMVYVSTVNSPSSACYPWMLGYAEGRLGKVCILPVMDCDYDGQDYLKFYPYVEYSHRADIPSMDFWVHDQDDSRKCTLLKTWMNRK